MSQTERTVNLSMARRIRFFRRRHGNPQTAMARLMRMPRTPYRYRELGIRPVSPDFLLRFQMALGIGIRELWFPVDPEAQVIHSGAVLEVALRSDRETRQPTIQDVLAVTAEAFGVPLEAVTSGLHHRRLIQARTAAAFVVAAHPWLKLSELAGQVRRTVFGLASARNAARERAGEDFWRKVEAIQGEVDAI